jgi:REP element-mobilizing transposase RayT
MAGGVYHVIARGNERRDIFRDDFDRRLYLARLAECRDRYAFALLAFCLMPNHVHLAIERGPVALSKIVLALHFYYSQKFNFRHKRVGHLFQGRYKAFLVQRDRYFAALIRYIHLNPVKAGIVECPEAYPWSSDRWYRRGSGPEWLDVDRFLSRLAPDRTRAAATYCRWMGSAESEAYEDVATVGRVVKGGEEFAQRSIQTIQAPAVLPRRWTAAAFSRLASEIQGIPFDRLKGPYKGRAESRARLIASFIGVRDHSFSTAAMADCFGRDDSTIAHGLRRLESALSREPALRRRVDRIAAALKAESPELQG